MSTATEPTRIVSLDAFRGLSVAAMVLVNNPGDWGHIYWPLDHARWHGWTPTDLIFPFFLFIVGVALPFSRRGTFGQALRRSAALIGLGLFMAAYPRFDLATLRWPGVLQRIGLCYLAGWCLRHGLHWRGQVAVLLLLLSGYWLAMTRVPLPGGVPPNLAPETNFAAVVDRSLLDGHMWRQTKTWDPEGITSTFPALATTLLGVLAGAWLRSAATPEKKALGLLGTGLALTLAGLAWHSSFPINKNLWTSSYVLFTGGFAAYVLGLWYWLADARGYRAAFRPFLAWGRNAILVFVASGLVAKTLALVSIAPGGPSLQKALFEAVFQPRLDPWNASLAYALANVLVWHVVLAWLDRRRWYLSV